MTTPISSRRRFLKSSSTLAAGSFLAAATRGFGQETKQPIRIGNIGCGGRGSFVAGLFQANEDFQIVAAADYFQDKLDAYGDQFSVDKSRRFSGIDGYKKLLEDDSIDVIAIHSPPYFHPEHTQMAVDAGKHVFVAKPIAVDVPGVRTVEESAKKAAANGLCVMVDVQCRGDEFFREAVRRVQKENALGTFNYGRCVYEMGALAPQAEGDSAEAKLRNWVFYRDYSGDIITEQNIHALDIFVWALGRPKSASGRSGRTVRLEPGDTSDHYALTFDYETGAVQFSSRQYTAWGAEQQITNELFGSKGALLTSFGGQVIIRGGKENFYRGGESPQLYSSGSEANLREFAKSIREKSADISTVAEAADTTLTTILGRLAAEAGKPVTWEEMAASTVKLQPTLPS